MAFKAGKFAGLALVGMALLCLLSAWTINTETAFGATENFNLSIELHKDLEFQQSQSIEIEYEYTKDGEGTKLTEEIDSTTILDAFNNIQDGNDFAAIDCTQLEIDEASTVNYTIKIRDTAEHKIYTISSGEASIDNNKVTIGLDADGNPISLDDIFSQSPSEDLCNCVIHVNSVQELTDVVYSESDVYYAALNQIKSLVDFEVDTSNCNIHNGSEPVVDFKFSTEIKDESNGNGEITTQYFIVSNFLTDRPYKAILNATITYGDVTETVEIPVSISVVTGSADGPVVEDIEVTTKGGRKVLIVTVEPNGATEASFYLSIPMSDGTEKEEYIGITDDFDKRFLWFGSPVETKFEIPYSAIQSYDKTAPQEVDISSITIERTAPGSRNVRISWQDPGDSTYQVGLFVIDNRDEKSNRENVDIKSEGTEQSLSIEGYSGAYDESVEPVYSHVSSPLDGERFTSDDTVVVSLDYLYWFSEIHFTSYDDNGNASSEVKVSVPHNVIYTTYANALVSGFPEHDTTAQEGSTQTLQPEQLDKMAGIHDPAWNDPSLTSATIIKEAGSVRVMDGQSSAGEPVEGMVISLSTATGYTNDSIITYYYTQVRKDIPAMYGYFNVHIAAVNQAPVAVDDGTSVTDVLNAQSSTTIDIPTSLLLANDTDREDGTGANGKLRISRVSNPSTGSVTLTLNSQGEPIVRFIPTQLFYGLATFEYTVIDTGGLESINAAKVSINIERSSNPPKASDVETMMELTLTSKAITLIVDNAGGETYNITNIGQVYVNGSPVNQNDSRYGINLTIALSEDEQGNVTPYIRMDIASNNQFKNGDIVSFGYTVGNNLGSSSATIRVEMTTGDDPNDREGYLYVHRRPLASFIPIIELDAGRTRVESATIPLANEKSYDLDHNLMHAASNPIASAGDGSGGATRPSYSYMGIRSWEWGIKTLSGDWVTKVFDADGYSRDPSIDHGNTAGGGTTGAVYQQNLTDYGTADAARAAGVNWIQQQIDDLLESQKQSGNYETIIVALRVRDIDGSEEVEGVGSDQPIGVWSDQRSIMLTALSLPPVAQFALDKSTYTGSADTPISITVTDMSYDPNGDTLRKWAWELTDSDGKVLWTQNLSSSNNTYVSQQVSSTIQGIVSNPNWRPKSPEFTLKLVVTDSENLESDPYSITFNVYKNNEEPEIDDSNTSMTLKGSTVYEIDKGTDGVIADTWGTISNRNGHSGLPDFKNFFRVTDDQNVNTLTVGWLFEGENVKTRAEWSERLRVVTSKAYTENPGYNQSTGLVPPFVNKTVTDEGFTPGAYRVSLTVTDHPSEAAGYPPNSSKTSYWSTYGDKKPYHLYVVPSLFMQSQVEFNGWVLSISNKGGYLENLSYRISDGKTAQELGVSLEDIIPTIGDTVTIRVTTNQYVTGMYGYNDYNGSLSNGTPGIGQSSQQADNFNDSGDPEKTGWQEGELKFTMTQGEQNEDGTYEWTGKYTIEDIDDAREGEEFTELRLALHGWTNWGSEEGKITRSKDVLVPVMVLPVKLYDFRVTSATDPAISNILRDYIQTLQSSGELLDNGKSTDGVLVKHLAVDRNSKPSSYTADMSGMSKGYSFYFKLSSKGLTKDGDQVRIYPRIFKAITDANGNVTSIGEELAGYVPDETGKYKIYTHDLGDGSIDKIDDMYELKYSGDENGISLNTHRELIIPSELRVEEGSEQTWSGRYGVPTDARFFELDEVEAGHQISTSIEWRGDILITFEIQAWKNGTSRYNYVERKQWQKERTENGADPLKTVYIQQETEWLNNKDYLGSVIIYDTSKSVRDDYISNPVWRE